MWELEVDRIDHGTNIVEDEALVEEVRKRGLGLTCVSCISHGTLLRTRLDFCSSTVSDAATREANAG